MASLCKCIHFPWALPYPHSLTLKAEEPPVGFPVLFLVANENKIICAVSSQELFLDSYDCLVIVMPRVHSLTIVRLWLRMFCCFYFYLQHLCLIGLNSFLSSPRWNWCQKKHLKWPFNRLGLSSIATLTLSMTFLSWYGCYVATGGRVQYLLSNSEENCYKGGNLQI